MNMLQLHDASVVLARRKGEMHVDEATVGRVWEYETGALKPDEIVALFRHLFMTGMIWDLPTVYLNHAGEMFNRGFFNSPKGTN